MLGPIFMRELVTVPRRTSHYAVRVAMLCMAGILGATTWQATVGFTHEPTLGESARFGSLFFQIMVFVQLGLLIFFAALSSASTVSQEKDRRTFLLLLLTDMYDYEIVVGKLLGALLPIVAFLVISLPMLWVLLVMGGIDPTQVLQASAVLLTTALSAGSLGGLVALWRERTFQALALSVLFVAMYLSLTQAIGAVGPLLIETVDWQLVQQCCDPFSAMASVLNLPPGGWPGIAPAYGFAITMLVGCVLLNGFGILKLRKWNPSGEPIMQREGAEEDPEATMNPEELRAFRSKAHAAPGKVRGIWANPILWREIRTLAYGRRPLLVKVAYGLVLALTVYFAIQTLNQPGGAPSFASAYGLVPITVLSLLLIAAQAVTSITSERDGGSLDITSCDGCITKRIRLRQTLGRGL